MFAGIGVTLHFRTSAPEASETDVIVIEFVDNTPVELLPGAWAEAQPYEGIHFRIFRDRLPLHCSQQLLAHVMVHEITHTLQRIDRHSAEGIMQALTAEDVDLICRGMDARAARRARQEALAVSLRAASISAEQ